MKITLETAVYKPVCVTFETQEEVDKLVDALYQVQTGELGDDHAEAIRELRVELYSYTTQANN